MLPSIVSDSGSTKRTREEVDGDRRRGSRGTLIPSPQSWIIARATNPEESLVESYHPSRVLGTERVK